MTTRTTIRRRRDDQGALLVFAILIITVIALITGFVLTRGDGSLRATVALRDAARSAYAADAAAQVAINDLRTGYNVGSGEPSPWYYTNAIGTGCFGYDGSGGATTPKGTLTLNNLIRKQSGQTQGAMSAAVVCEPEDATGEQGSAVLINGSNKPGNAILTLGTSTSETGFTFKTNGSGAAFRVKGGIWANSNIVRDNNGNLESTESIRAHTGCTPLSAMVAPTVNCNAATAADPNYPSELSVASLGVPDLAAPPASCPNGGTVELYEGYYDDVTKLNALTNTNSTCFVHFNPGTYYFDFHNDSTDALFDTDLATASGNTWTIGGRKTVVAGTLTGDATVPGRCVNPINDENAKGVQFIFGATSRLLIEANGQDTAVEICGSYSKTRPPIAIYGQRTGTATQTVLTEATGDSGDPLTAGTVTLNNAGTFSNPTTDALKDVGGLAASWNRTNSGNPQTATLSLRSFALPSGTTMPKGSVLKSARLRVTHSEKTASTLTIKPTGSSVSQQSPTLAASTSMTTTSIDLSALPGLNGTQQQAWWRALKQHVHDNGFTGLDVDVTGNPKVGETSTVDAVRLELSYYAPQLRAQSGSIATPGGDPVIKVDGNSTTYYVQGTTYTPAALIDLSLNNLDESVFRFGVIARSLKVFETGSFSYPGAVIELPDNSPGFGFETTLVRLKVYLCPDDGSAQDCTPARGELALESRVKLFDVGGVAGPPNRQISILSWSHKR